VLHLNQTAAEYAYHLVKQTPPDTVAKTIAQRYNVPTSDALQDFNDLSERINILINTEDLDPVMFLGFDRDEPYSGNTSAPFRLDCALTYGTSEGYAMDVPIERVTRELQTEEWLEILNKAWEAGNPHIVFTGGEPTLRPDLVELVAGAEKNGQVTGLITDGLRISNHEFLQKLLLAGLDHMLIVLDPTSEISWEAIRDAVSEDISLAVHLTLTPKNQQKFTTLIDRLAGMGVVNLSISTSDASMKEHFEQLQQYIADHGMKLIWDLPVPYSHQNPVANELAQTGEAAEGAGKAWLYIEPDGDVIPGQGIVQAIGNMLSDPWEKIWSAASGK
jgi:organic radical activating enzyme